MEVRTWHARHNKNITLKQLQDLTGITKTALNDIENGKKLSDGRMWEVLTARYFSA
ncbi:helix-turn-helix domain-containing protein, partial [Anaerostipes sp. AF04-45]|uniref:helix-turn-helix domain-containing protein n=1 Tax=Anaerostipes sp. AF04-45 TaxID=2292912 RepID=UPI000E8F2A6E